jgi:hypothetical protein
MVACGKENQEGTSPAIWPVNPLCDCIHDKMSFFAIKTRNGYQHWTESRAHRNAQNLQKFANYVPIGLAHSTA